VGRAGGSTRVIGGADLCKPVILYSSKSSDGAITNREPVSVFLNLLSKLWDGLHLHSHLTRQMVLPLPAGEGRGEGKGSVPLHVTVAYPTDLAVMAVEGATFRA
jgi:hypothetical protein